MSSPMMPVGPRRLKLYWADKFFTKPGLYIWAFKNNRRILPWPKRWS